MAIFKKTKKDDQRTYSQWKLMRMRFARHKLAKISLVLLALLYLMAIFADFIAPYDPAEYDSGRTAQTLRHRYAIPDRAWQSALRFDDGAYASEHLVRQRRGLA